MGSSDQPKRGAPAPERPLSVRLDGRPLPIESVLAYQGKREVELVLSTAKLECDAARRPQTRSGREVRVWLAFARPPAGGDHRLVSGGFASDGEGLTKRRRAVLEGAVVERMLVRTAPGERMEIALRARLTQLQHGDAGLGDQTLDMDGTIEAMGCGE